MELDTTLLLVVAIYLCSKFTIKEAAVLSVKSIPVFLLVFLISCIPTIIKTAIGAASLASLF